MVWHVIISVCHSGSDLETAMFKTACMRKMSSRIPSLDSVRWTLVYSEIQWAGSHGRQLWRAKELRKSGSRSLRTTSSNHTKDSSWYSAKQVDLRRLAQLNREFMTALQCERTKIQEVKSGIVFKEGIWRTCSILPKHDDVLGGSLDG